MFALSFVEILIVAALIWTALGAVALLVLLAFDFKNKNIW